MTNTLLKETKVIDIKKALDNISTKRERLNNQVEVEIGDNLKGFITVCELKKIFSNNDDYIYIENEGWL